MDVKNREYYQNEAFQAAKKSDFNCAILATVAFGKGRVISLIIEELYNRGCRSFLYCCDNQRLRDIDFPNELDKWLSKTILSNIKITFECYQTTFRRTNINDEVLLGDEFDMAITPQYSKTFFNNKFKHKILVSGTLSPSKKQVLEQIVPIVYKFTTIDAENAGIINKTAYYLYNYRMTESESREYRKWTTAIAKAIAAEKPPNQINFLLGKRKEILYTLESSYIHVRKVMKWLWDNDKKTRLIIFCERTTQADRVCKYSYYGGNENLDNLTKFQNNEISGLSVVSKIKRGINLKNTNTAIFESLAGSSTTEFEQKSGRMKRLNITELATVIIMLPWYSKIDQEGNKIYKPTIVDQWIHKSTSNLNITFKDLKL